MSNCDFDFDVPHDFSRRLKDRILQQPKIDPPFTPAFNIDVPLLAPTDFLGGVVAVAAHFQY